MRWPATTISTRAARGAQMRTGEAMCHVLCDTGAMGVTLVVSPHLDDAALSIGGSIARWTAEGERVVVASVYTTGPALDEIAEEMRKFADYTKRRAEDIEALSVLRAEHRWLDQIERAFRRPFLTGWNFFRTPSERAG